MKNIKYCYMPHSSVVFIFLDSFRILPTQPQRPNLINNSRNSKIFYDTRNIFIKNIVTKDVYKMSSKKDEKFDCYIQRERERRSMSIVLRITPMGNGK